MITRKELHKVEMDLCYLLDENCLTRERIIKEFSNLISGAEE